MDPRFSCFRETWRNVQVGPRRNHPALCDGGIGTGGEALDKRAWGGATGSLDLRSQTELA